MTDNVCEYFGSKGRPYELLLQLSDIEHRKTKVRTPQTNWFVESFNRTFKEYFSLAAFRTKIYTSIEELQDEKDKWLEFNNYQRSYRGYQNLGKRPFGNIKSFIFEPSIC